ncbi:hypothetical protein GC194_13420 [bacterium]|nr:hypothetical protein [bacterium]
MPLILVILGLQWAVAQKQYSLQTSYHNQAVAFYGGIDDYSGLLLGRWQNSTGSLYAGTLSFSLKKQGLELSQTPIFFGENERINVLLARKQTPGFLAVGFEKACHLQAAGNYIYLLDPALQKVNTRFRVSYFFRNIDEPVTMSEFLTDDVVVLAHQKLLVSYNLQTRQAIGYNDSLQHIANLMPLDEKRFVCTDSNRFHILNSSCQIVSSSDVGFAITHLQALSKGRPGYVGIASQKLAVLNNGGHLIYDHNWQELAVYFDSLKHIFWHQDSLCLLGKKGPKWRLAILNDKFEVVAAYKIPLKEVPLDVRLIDNKILSLSRRLLNGHRIDNLSISRRTKNRLYRQPHAFITSVYLDSMAISSDFTYLHPKFYIDVELGNNGPDTLKKVALNWQSSNDTSCRGKVFAQNFKVKIPPGYKQVVPFIFTDSFLVPETQYRICIRVSSPNGMADTLQSGRSGCTEVTLPVGIEQMAQSNFDIPTLWHAGDQIDIKGAYKAQLVDLTGRVYHLQGPRLQIPNTLPTGFYFIRIQRNNANLCKKIYLIN